MSKRTRFWAFKRFARRKSGATALEFALVAPWFFMILFGMIEIALVGFAQSSLDYAVGETARRIRTGQVQAQGLGAQGVQNEVCTNLRRMMALPCTDLFVDVDPFNNFLGAGGGPPMVNGQLNMAQIGYQNTATGQVVLVRGYYRWRFITPMFQPILGDMADGRRLLVSSILFRNEPF